MLTPYQCSRTFPTMSEERTPVPPSFRQRRLKGGGGQKRAGTSQVHPHTSDIVADGSGENFPKIWKIAEIRC